MSAMHASVKAYFQRIGSKGGRRSRRSLSAEEARAMVRVREARRFYRQFHPVCFWSSPLQLGIGKEDVPWVIACLRRHGGRAGWEAANRLCR